jgi:hypothetical protein
VLRIALGEDIFRVLVGWLDGLLVVREECKNVQFFAKRSEFER